MKIGLLDVDGGHFPNYALMKVAAFHKSQGDEVEWANPLFGRYDRVYKSKIFTFTEDDKSIYPCEVVKGGTGYSLTSQLPDEIERMNPDYSIYNVDKRTAYGFLTRGCPNKCKWCVVPKKEGPVRPYRDVEEIAEGGRTNLILMDNNILASDYGLAQIEKIVRNRYRVDFNQALDARRVTDEIAQLLAKVRWMKYIRFGCDTPAQIAECERAMRMIDKYRGKEAYYLMYTMINDDIDEAYSRISHFRGGGGMYKWLRSRLGTSTIRIRSFRNGRRIWHNGP
jgi:radical SAM superfamily enzyme YgiQ (UPF0313 family)